MRRIFCAVKSVSSAALLVVMQGRDTSLGAEETSKTVLRKFPRKSINLEVSNIMKELMIGNAALARGIYEAGCSVISSYPGTPSTEITEEFAKFSDAYCEWAPNEKVAMEAAFGASLRGKRSACCMKHVGLNVAADPLFTMSYTGVNAGLVICVADDPGMHSSQNEQDSRHYAIASKVPMLEPADSQEALDFAKIAFALSEQYDTPVFIKMCTRVAHSQSIVEKGERTEVTKEYVKGRENVVIHPLITQYDRTTDSANKTVSTLLRIIRTFSVGEGQDLDRKDDLMAAINGGDDYEEAD